MTKNPLSIAVGALLLAVFVVLLFVFQVRKGEVALVTTFGKPTRDAGPGPHARWPWPIQSVHKFDQRVQNFESKFEQVLTSDEYNLLIMVYVGWNISDPKIFFQRFGESTTRAEDSLEGLIRNAYSGVVGKHPFAHFISTDPKELQFIEIEKEMLARIQSDAAANGYGIEVKFLGLKKLGLPESVTKLVFERMESQRHTEMTKIQANGEQLAEQIKSDANLVSAKMLADAEAEATRIRGKAEEIAAGSFAVFEKNPELANFLLKLTAMELLTKERTTLILDQGTPPLDLLRAPVPTSPKK